MTMMSATGRTADSEEAKQKPKSGCVLRGPVVASGLKQKWGAASPKRSMRQSEMKLTASAVECPKSKTAGEPVWSFGGTHSCRTVASSKAVGKPSSFQGQP